MVNPILLLRNRWLIKWMFLGSLSLMMLTFWGIVLALLLSTLAYLPKYRKWLQVQPGYKYYLARLPGLHNTDSIKLSLVTLAYLLPVSLLCLTLLWSTITTQMDEAIGDFIISIIGLAFIFTWFTGKWGFKNSSLITRSGRLVKTSSWRKFLEGMELDIAEYETRKQRWSSEALLGVYNLPLWKRWVEKLSLAWYNVQFLKVLAWPWPFFATCMALVSYGIVLLPLGMGLAFIPSYRHWLVRQPGYIRRLTRLPGLRSCLTTRVLSPLRLAMVTLVYLSPAFCFSFLYYGPLFTSYRYFIAELPIYLLMNIICIAGLAVLYGWFLRNWHLGIVESIAFLQPLLRLLSSKRKTFEQLYAHVGQTYQQLPLGQAVQAATALRDMALQYFGESSSQYALSMNMLGLAYQHTGDYKTAELLFQQAGKLLGLAKGTNHPTYASCLGNLGLLYSLKGDYVAAERLLRQGFAIERRTLGWHRIHLAISLNNLGQLYCKMGDYELARSLFRSALDIYRRKSGEEHPQYAMGLDSIAILLEEEGNYNEALKLFLQARNIRGRYLGERHPDFATSLSNIASLYKRMGNYAAAESLYYQVIDIRRQYLGKEHPDFATSLNNLALLYSHQGNYIQAERLLRQALVTARKALGENHPTVGTCLINLALQCAVLGRTDEALDKMKRAIDTDHQMVGQVFSVGSEDQRMEFLAKLRNNTDLFLSLILRSFASSFTSIRAGLELTLRRKALGAAALATLRDAIQINGSPALKAKVHELKLLSRRISQRILNGPASEGWSVYERELKEWNDRKQAMEADIAQQIQQMNLTLQLATLNQEAIVQALPPDTALIEFIRFNEFDFKAPNGGRWQPARYLAFVLCSGEQDSVRMIDLGEAEQIDKMIATLREAIADEEKRRLSPDAWKSAGADLRVLVFDPLLTTLCGRTSLFLAPDGDISLLPFEVLSLDNDRCLIDDYHLCYLSVGRDVLSFKHQETSQFNPPLIIADPDFDFGMDKAPKRKDPLQFNERQSRNINDSVHYFERLEKTEKEGRKVADLLSVLPVLQEAALKTRLTNCDSPYILHIATHGFFLPNQAYDSNKEQPAIVLSDKVIRDRIGQLEEQHTENPLLRSGLALAGVNTWNQGRQLPQEAGNGILTADEASELNLLTTELVVLSACETGLGEMRIGEGVFGLRRAFILAGAGTLLISLWQVPDDSTMRLMVDFYTRVKAGQACSEALRIAQLTRREKKPHPYYWGGFICQGDPRPLSKYYSGARR